MIVTRSLNRKQGAIPTRSTFPLIPKGLDDPCWCNVNICIAANAANTNGNKKCKAKNRFKVAELTENPPHTNITKSLPIHGIADSRLVITVLPHIDI